ncbi:nuclear transport factor 2 family protein [Streptomyces sp. NPDC091217]|uniref:nuclear transport factor 2 family protein n=1 Tax=Streptomyces sp. NPDC091217 TaxID=3365975 RepID=UPI00380A49AC
MAYPARSGHGRTHTASGRHTRQVARVPHAGDPGPIAELYAEDLDRRLNRPEDEHDRPATLWITHRTGRADAAAHVRDLAAHHVPGQADTRIERVLVDGAEAVVLGEIRQTAKPTGRPYRARSALHLTVRDGPVVRHHVYEDGLAVARAFAS